MKLRCLHRLPDVWVLRGQLTVLAARHLLREVQQLLNHVVANPLLLLPGAPYLHLRRQVLQEQLSESRSVTAVSWGFRDELESSQPHIPRLPSYKLLVLVCFKRTAVGVQVSDCGPAGGPLMSSKAPSHASHSYRSTSFLCWFAQTCHPQIHFSVAFVSIFQHLWVFFLSPWSVLLYCS